MQSHIGCIWIIFSRVSLQMCPQSSFPKIKTFIWFFSWMISQLSPQIVCINQQIVALIAFVWFFSRVSIEMPNQIACMNWCKFSLVASARFFQSEFSHVLSICLHWQTHSELVALASFFFSTTDYFSTHWAVLDSQSVMSRLATSRYRDFSHLIESSGIGLGKKVSVSVSKKSQYWSQKFWSRK